MENMSLKLGRIMYDLAQLLDYESGIGSMTVHETGNGFGAGLEAKV